MIFLTTIPAFTSALKVFPSHSSSRESQTHGHLNPVQPCPNSQNRMRDKHAPDRHFVSQFFPSLLFLSLNPYTLYVSHSILHAEKIFQVLRRKRVTEKSACAANFSFICILFFSYEIGCSLKLLRKLFALCACTKAHPLFRLQKSPALNGAGLFCFR